LSRSQTPSAHPNGAVNTLVVNVWMQWVSRSSCGTRVASRRPLGVEGKPGQPSAFNRPLVNLAALRRRADSGDEGHRPARSQRCARHLGFAPRVDGGCRCGGTDVGGWRYSTRGTCAVLVTNLIHAYRLRRADLSDVNVLTRRCAEAVARQRLCAKMIGGQ
jgi:hypothetical protein